MTHLNIEKISLAARDREKEKLKRSDRKKSLLLLIHNYLEKNGFIDSARSLENETNLNINDYAVCDNVNLDFILQDYEAYHFLKYQKLPDIIKILPKDNPNGNARKQIRKQNSARNRTCVTQYYEETASARAYQNSCSENAINNTINNEFEGLNENCITSLSSFQNSSLELKNLADLIMQDFGKHNKLLKLPDVVGHCQAKQILKEAIIYPLKYNELFTEINSNWNSILLYGPTGTGKTFLVSAAAAESKVAYFKVNLSSLISKWRGESEKLVKVLFDLAKHYAPSIIFIDEIDALLNHRGSDHEASRRMKTEFFIQMDGLNHHNKLVLVIGATNMPWELDQAILRRLEKRVLIDLPDKPSRIMLFEKFLSCSFLSKSKVSNSESLDYEKLACLTENYSASDIEIVCKEAKMDCNRRVIEVLEKYHAGKSVPESVSVNLKMSDVVLAVEKVKPSNSKQIEKFTEWKNQYGSE